MTPSGSELSVRPSSWGLSHPRQGCCRTEMWGAAWRCFRDPQGGNLCNQDHRPKGCKERVPDDPWEGPWNHPARPLERCRAIRQSQGYLGHGASERRSPWLRVRACPASPKGSGVPPGPLANLRASAWLYALFSSSSSILEDHAGHPTGPPCRPLLVLLQAAAPAGLRVIPDSFPCPTRPGCPVPTSSPTLMSTRPQARLLACLVS